MWDLFFPSSTCGSSTEVNGQALTQEEARALDLLTQCGYEFARSPEDLFRKVPEAGGVDEISIVRILKSRPTNRSCRNALI